MKTPATAISAHVGQGRSLRHLTMAAALLFLLSVVGVTRAQPIYVVTTNFSSTGFTPNTSNDLILSYLGTLSGPQPSFTGSATTTAPLTDTFATDFPDSGLWVEIQNGDVLTYNIGAPCVINSIETCSAWNDNGRSQQDYTVDVSTDGVNWTTSFIVVHSGKAPAPKPSDVDMLITPTNGISLTNNIQYVRFNFPTNENGWVGYTEIIINGTSSVSPFPPTVTLAGATNVAVTNTAPNVTIGGAVATGYPPPALLWHFVNTNGTDIPLTGQTGTNLTFALISPTDAGEYYLDATSSQGSTNSAMITLTVTTPPAVPVIQTVYSQNTGFDPLNTNGDLLLGLADANIPVPVMTDGSDNNGSASGAGYHAFGGGAVQTFDFYAPCDIYEIDTYSGCASAANFNGIQVDQNYAVSVSSNNGATYTNLYAAQARLSPLYATSTPADMQVQLTPNNGATALASNVDHVRFTFLNDAENPNLQVNYMELMAYGINKLAPGAPTITRDVPATVPAVQYVSFSISVAALGNPIPSFQWYSISGGVTNQVPGATNSTLTIGQAQPTNAVQYQVVVSNAHGSVTSAVSTVVLYAVNVVSNTIYSDSFARIGPLIGSAPDIANTGNATWVGYPQLNTDGSELALTNTVFTNGATPNAFLPFTPQVGHIYTLSCDLEPKTGAAQWLALGFALTPVVTNYFAAVNGGVDWCLVRGNDTQFQIFEGPGGGLIQYNGGNNWPAPGNNNAFETFSLVLDTTTGSASSGWSMAVYTNGLLAIATNNVWSPNPAIQYVGLGADAATGYFKNFKLTDLAYQAVPVQLSVIGQPGSQALNWPSAYIGWALQSNSVGLQAANAWVTVPGSTVTNQIPLNVNQNMSSVFFRLLAP